MKPEKQNQSQESLFEKRLDTFLNKEHALIKLSKRIDWNHLEEKFGNLFDADDGRPGCATRLLAGMNYLKYLHNLSDRETLLGWLENPYWQYFCGEMYFQHKPPCHHTTIGKWRKRIGEEGAEFLLQESLAVAREAGLLRMQYLDELYVDTTVQEKNIAYPSEAKLLHKARTQLVKLARRHNLELRQSYTRVSKNLLVMAHRYAAAQQYNRQRRNIRKLRTLLGRVLRDIKRQLTPSIEPYFAPVLERIMELYGADVTKKRVLSLHEPYVEAIAKGKMHKRFEYGVKVSVVTTRKRGFILGCKAIHGNPYDGHTLQEALKDVEARVGRELFARVGVDLGYRGHGIKERIKVFHPRLRKLPKKLKLFVRARSKIEATISLLKRCYRLGRNYLKGKLGDVMNSLLSASAHNLAIIVRSTA